jgi:sulfate adenylyltransferase subunit 2
MNAQSKISLTHLEQLEAESIHIMREVVAETEKPVMLYSVGKDSAVMLHLARKAFYPAPPPFPLLHVDTTWKFKAMYELRDRVARESGMELIVYQNPEAKERGINPFDHGSAHTDMWKTEGLKQALDKYGFDAAFGGARRDEEKSRAKERIFSFRSASHRWDPKNQRPELWNLYNARKAPGESIRVFPLSNWTELDIWQYIYAKGKCRSIARSASAPWAATLSQVRSRARLRPCPKSSRKCSSPQPRKDRAARSITTAAARWSARSRKAISKWRPS